MKNGVCHYRIGDHFDGFLFVKSCVKGTTSNGNPFLTIVLQDKSGEIEAKLWDATPEDEKTYTAETIIKVSGEVTSFRGRPQLKVKAIRPARQEDGVAAKDFIQTAPLDVQKMADVLTQYIFAMENPNIQRLTRQLVKKHQRAFFEYPAAVKNHHEYFSGLAFHVVSMLEAAAALVRLYPTLNRDLLYAGVILHDLGKVMELSGPIATSYTLEGKLVGHISLVAAEIRETARELGIEGEEVTLLTHMVLSHHGKAEWGSPKPPMLREAEVLHMLDYLDARIQMMDRVLARTEPGSFSERVPALDHRSFYRPTFDDAEKSSNETSSNLG